MSLVMPHRSIAHTNIHRIHTLHPRSVVHRVEILLHRIHTLHLRSGRHCTVKNLKHHWVAYNKHVSLFNQIYNYESSNMQSRADDGMVLEIAKQGYKNRTGAEFKRFH
jgi:hypothetical protein